MSYLHTTGIHDLLSCTAIGKTVLARLEKIKIQKMHEPLGRLYIHKTTHIHAVEILGLGSIKNYKSGYLIFLTIIGDTES